LDYGYIAARALQEKYKENNMKLWTISEDNYLKSALCARPILTNVIESLLGSCDEFVNFDIRYGR
jgi:hypothetical protein